MFSPNGSNSEFVELYNTSETDTIDLSGVKIKYQTSTADLIKPVNDSTLLPPKSFAVIFEGDYDFQNGIYKSLISSSALVLKINDNAFGSAGMSNTSDRTLYLLNSAGDTLSAYTYSANNNPGISDEKILMTNDNSASNWANSLIINGTPGFKNSVTPIDLDLRLSAISISPLQPIDGDNVTINVKVKNVGLAAADNYSIEIFNDVNFDSAGGTGELIFNQQYSNLAAGDSVSASAVLNSLVS